MDSASLAAAPKQKAVSKLTCPRSSITGAAQLATSCPDRSNVFGAPISTVRESILIAEQDNKERAPPTPLPIELD